VGGRGSEAGRRYCRCAQHNHADGRESLYTRPPGPAISSMWTQLTGARSWLPGAGYGRDPALGTGLDDPTLRAVVATVLEHIGS